MSCKNKKGYTPAKAAKIKRRCEDSGRYWYEKTCSCLDKKPALPKWDKKEKSIKSIKDEIITYK